MILFSNLTICLNSKTLLIISSGCKRDDVCIFIIFCDYYFIVIMNLFQVCALRPPAEWVCAGDGPARLVLQGACVRTPADVYTFPAHTTSRIDKSSHSQCHTRKSRESHSICDVDTKSSSHWSYCWNWSKAYQQCT